MPSVPNISETGGSPASTDAHGTSAYGHDASKSLNVLGTRLVVHGLNPVTGYFRNGFCDTDATDVGNHSIAGVVTDDFLDFSAARGNDLRKVGVKNGCRWCLCVNRWREAFDAFKKSEVPRHTVPRVVLEATHERATQRGGVTLDQLKEFSGGSDRSLQYWLSGGKQMQTDIGDVPVVGAKDMSVKKAVDEQKAQAKTGDNVNKNTDVEDKKASDEQPRKPIVADKGKAHEGDKDTSAQMKNALGERKASDANKMAESRDEGKNKAIPNGNDAGLTLGKMGSMLKEKIVGGSKTSPPAKGPTPPPANDSKLPVPNTPGKEGVLKDFGPGDMGSEV